MERVDEMKSASSRHGPFDDHGAVGTWTEVDWRYPLNEEAILDLSFCVSGQDSTLQISKEF